MQGLIHGLAVGPMPRATAQQTGKRWCWRRGLSLLKRARLLPKLFGHQARGDLTAEAARQAQPALPALTAELPAWQHRPHPRQGLRGLEQRRIKKRKPEQHARAGQRRSLRRAVLQAREAQLTEALRKLKAARTTELQLLRDTGSRKAEARLAIPQRAEAITSWQHRHGLERIQWRQGQRQAEHSTILQGLPMGGSLAEQVGEAGGLVHHTTGGLLKCMGLSWPVVPGSHG